MGAMAGMMEIDAIYLRHDLMVEIGRVEMALEALRQRDIDQRAEVMHKLEDRRAKLNAQLSRLTA